MSSNHHIRVLILGPGKRSEGGIRSVISRIIPELNASGEVDVTWLGTHRTGSPVAKISCMLGALFKSVYYLARTDVVHVHGSIGPSILRKSLFIWLARLYRRPVVFHFHATMEAFREFFDRGGIVAAYCKLTLRHCQRIVVLSDKWRTVVQAALPESDISVIYNPVMDVDQSQVGAVSDQMRVLYLAHLVERKGYHDLINAFAMVSARAADARLVFCGSGDEEKALEMCEALNIADRVEFRGWISDDEKVDELVRTTVFCLPSYDEGLPMGILEAMSFGLPIATTPVGGIPDVLKHEVNALLFEPGDVSAMADALTRLLLDPGLRQSLASNALQDSAEFRPSRIGAQWVQLYADVTGRDKRGRQASTSATDQELGRRP